MELPKILKDEIWEYCRLNSITNIDDFTLKLVKQGFTVEKYGSTPTAKERVVEKIVEKIVEVPVEKIVEKIVEVPVTMVDTEVTESLKKNMLEVEKLKSELSTCVESNTKLKLDLDKCKNENKRDIYGES